VRGIDALRVVDASIIPDIPFGPDKPDDNHGG
jgi:hypothetical protein